MLEGSQSPASSSGDWCQRTARLAWPPGLSLKRRGILAQMVKNLPTMQEIQI